MPRGVWARRAQPGLGANPLGDRDLGWCRPWQLDPAITAQQPLPAGLPSLPPLSPPLSPSRAEALGPCGCGQGRGLLAPSCKRRPSHAVSCLAFRSLCFPIDAPPAPPHNFSLLPPSCSWLSISPLIFPCSPTIEGLRSPFVPLPPFPSPSHLLSLHRGATQSEARLLQPSPPPARRRTQPRRRKADTAPARIPPSCSG